VSGAHLWDIVSCHKGTSLKPKTLTAIPDGAGISRADFFKLR
jgi:hypothetical protein